MRLGPVVPLKDSVTLREEVISQWQDLWRDFLQNTSLHGSKNINCHKRHKIVRVVWTVLLLAMAGVCLKTLTDLYSRYYSYSFTTKITRERKQQIRFPSITICNRNKFHISQKNLNDTQLNYLRHTGDLEEIYPSIDWNGKEGTELNKMDNVKFWERGAYKEEDMFKMTYFKNQPFNVMRLNYSQKQDQRCFTFNGGDFVSENSGLTFVIDIMQWTYLDGGVYEAGVTMKYLPHPYNSRGTDCVDTKASHFVNPLEWFKVYSFDGCLQECSNKAAMDAL
ncbi:acid-sensing ion channel 1-like [Haliotis rubra]|uniref:acid-sensing ion channel 1-like n=1 Tax=Haliotis rubra TaxID=36100 RepID=UPI001EE575F1|nr:acid-sensing ion channel 1-like [Haliotis rubra]